MLSLGERPHRIPHFEVMRVLGWCRGRASHAPREHATIPEPRPARDATRGEQCCGPQVPAQRCIPLFKLLGEPMHRQRELMACLERVQILVGGHGPTIPGRGPAEGSDSSSAYPKIETTR